MGNHNLHLNPEEEDDDDDDDDNNDDDDDGDDDNNDDITINTSILASQDQVKKNVEHFLGQNLFWVICIQS